MQIKQTYSRYSVEKHVCLTNAIRGFPSAPEQISVFKLQGFQNYENATDLKGCLSPWW